jgi:hypothetical protein
MKIVSLMLGGSVFLSSFQAISMSGAPGGANPAAGLYGEAQGIARLVEGSTKEDLQLRTNLMSLSAKLISFGGVSPGQFTDKSKAQSVSAAIDSVLNMITGSSVSSTVNAAEAVKGNITNNVYLSGLFIQQGNNPSVWDGLIYPQLLTAFIRLQASYAASVVQYLSVNVQRLTPQEVSVLNNTVQSALNQLNSLT